MSYDNAPLPDGWVREFDPTSKHPFWVDTKAQPPRSVWVHPYEDEQFLREHPDVRDRLAQDGPSGAPPPYSPRRHSYGGSPSDSHLGVPDRSDAMRTSHSQPGTPNPGQPHRGFFGKLKDKTIGTKEEREVRRQEEKRREELYMQQVAEQRRLRREALQQRVSSGSGRYGGTAYGGGFGQQYGQSYGQPTYAVPAGSPFGLGGGRFGRSGFGGGGLGRSGFGGGGFGGGGLAFPLLAGAAGGFLLGDILDGPDYGGGYGGGGFDGGGFDGGGFDGGFN